VFLVDQFGRVGVNAAVVVIRISVVSIISSSGTCTISGPTSGAISLVSSDVNTTSRDVMTELLLVSQMRQL